MTVTKLTDKLLEINPADDLPAAILHADESLLAVLYQPQKEDKQTPHDQDEYYFVAQGAATVTIEGVAAEVGCGDAIFVPALAEHKFTDATEDFACWAVFYGAKKQPDSAG